MLHEAKLYVRTLPHLKPWQVVGRLVAPIRSRVRPTVDPPEDLDGRLEPRIPFLHHDPWNSREDILQGRFCFLNRAENLGRPLDWSASHAPLLWRFNLHYFHYLHLLNSAEQTELCRSWIAANPPKTEVSWHPYPTSHRIVNWCKANLTERDIQESLYRQAAHLRRNLETYVYGNHLIENARALVFAGRYFLGGGEANEWLAKGLQILKSESKEQILPDGGHYERSPMYHALMLEAYADVLNVLDLTGANGRWIAEIVQRMTDALASMTHPDGRIALFNDSTHEIAPSSAELQFYSIRLGARPATSKKDLPDTGYYIHESDDIYLVIDAGPGGPDHLMAHAHADVFSYELSIGGERFIVDTGVYEYPAGAKRRCARSTAAHNTVSIDGLDQIECWGSFRAARRAAPHSVSMRREDGKSTFEGTFRGYASLIGDDIEHRRTMSVDTSRRTIQIRDVIDGRGDHVAESRIHFHPAVEASDGFRRGDRRLQLDVSAGKLRWERVPYFPQFGVEEERTVAVVGGEEALPVRLEYTISY